MPDLLSWLRVSWEDIAEGTTSRVVPFIPRLEKVHLVKYLTDPL